MQNHRSFTGCPRACSKSESKTTGGTFLLQACECGKKSICFHHYFENHKFCSLSTLNICGPFSILSAFSLRMWHNELLWSPYHLWIFCSSNSHLFPTNLRILSSTVNLSSTFQFFFCPSSPEIVKCSFVFVSFFSSFHEIFHSKTQYCNKFYEIS